MKLIIVSFIFVASLASNTIVNATQDVVKDSNEKYHSIIRSTHDNGDVVAQIQIPTREWRKYTILGTFTIGVVVLAVGVDAIYNYYYLPECPEQISGEFLELANSASVAGKAICDFIWGIPSELVGKCINATCNNQFIEGKVWGQIFKLASSEYANGLPSCLYARGELSCLLQYYKP